MIWHLLRIGLGIFFCFLTYVLFEDGTFILSLVPLVLAFAILYTYFGDFITDPVGGFFFPNKGGQTSTEQFSKVYGLLANRKFEEAVSELKLITMQQPDLISGKVLLVNTLYENLNRSDEALEIGLEELKTDQWHSDHGKIVMSCVDILLDNREKGEAITLLEIAVLKLNQHELNPDFNKRLLSLKKNSS